MSRIIDLPGRNRTPVRRPFPLFLVLGGAALFCLGLVVGALLVVLVTPPAGKTVTTAADDKPKEATKTGKNRMTQAEVKKTALGKTPREALKTFGKPDSTYNTPDDLDALDYRGSWTYFHLCSDPANGTDRLTRLQFKDGRVDGVEF